LVRSFKTEVIEVSTLSRRELLKVGAMTSTAALSSAALFTQSSTQAKARADSRNLLEPSDGHLQVRMCRFVLDHPWYNEKHGHKDKADAFWDRDRWNKLLSLRAGEGYNAIYWWADPWTEEPTLAWFIPLEDYPEARMLSDEQFQRTRGHLTWLFGRARELGMLNFQNLQFIATTSRFAEAHQLKGVSVGGDFRGAAWGTRNELTRKFTESTIAELFKTYDSLDGIICPLGDSLPGKRSAWYREAVVPGLRRSGRNPICILQTWQLPFDDFMEDIAPKDVYENTWVNVDFNGENITDDRPYPIFARWAERGGLPTIFEVLDLNFEGNLPFNGPRYAHDIARNLRKVDHCVGFNYWGEPERDAENYIFRKALAYYGKTNEAYSDEPWLKLLVERFGDHDAAKHFLQAYEISGRITPELCALVWVPICTLEGRQLSLKYWYFSNMGKNLRIGYYNGSARGTELLPVKYYAWVVAQLGDQWVEGDPSGTNDNSPSGSQVYKWELADHPITPQLHLSRIREMGKRAFEESQTALSFVKRRHDAAEAICNYMQAYKLLTEYYEHKVAAAVSALIYGFGGPVRFRNEAMAAADKVVTLYETAANFIWEKIDKRRGSLKGFGGWNMGDHPASTLPELIAAEKQERAHFAELFQWPSASSIPAREQQSKL
jgi:hypothetical protein